MTDMKALIQVLWRNKRAWEINGLYIEEGQKRSNVHNWRLVRSLLWKKKKAIETDSNLCREFLIDYQIESTVKRPVKAKELVMKEKQLRWEILIILK